MANGNLLHVCISARKGIAKHEIPSANIVVEHGMEGDAHAGDWHRQLSLLAHVDIESMRAKGLTLKPGALARILSSMALIPTRWESVRACESETCFSN